MALVLLIRGAVRRCVFWKNMVKMHKYKWWYFRQPLCIIVRLNWVNQSWEPEWLIMKGVPNQGLTWRQTHDTAFCGPLPNPWIKTTGYTLVRGKISILNSEGKGSLVDVKWYDHKLGLIWSKLCIFIICYRWHCKLCVSLCPNIAVMSGISSTITF